MSCHRAKRWQYILYDYASSMNRIDWKPQAAKQLRKPPRLAQVNIRNAVQERLSLVPKYSGIKEPVNHACGYRLRVGYCRVLFDFNGTIKLDRIEGAGKRYERTY